MVRTRWCSNCSSSGDIDRPICNVVEKCRYVDVVIAVLVFTRTLATADEAKPGLLPHRP